jgi:hypothetical protein
MKRAFLQSVSTYGAMLTILCGIFAAPAHAVLQDFEPFDYTGTALAGQNGGTGWNGAWFTTSTTDNSVSNDGVSLTYPVSFESPLTTPTSSGSRVLTGGLASNASTSRMLAQTIPLNVDGTTRYVSALFRKNRPNGEATTDNILLEFVDASANRRWGVGIEGTGDKPWLNANGSTTPSSGPTVTVGDTYFMVAKIISSAAGQDQAFLKVFGTGYGSQVPVAEPTSWDATLNETTGAILDRIRVRIDTGNQAVTPGEIDDIRIATSWSEVIGGPAPANLNGDFNSDGKVDAGDYVTWAKNNGTTNALANDNGLGTPVDSRHYDLWRANFGNPPGSGNLFFAASVPEPSTLLLVPIAAAVLLSAIRRRSKLVLEPVRIRSSR